MSAMVGRRASPFADPLPEERPVLPHPDRLTGDRGGGGVLNSPEVTPCPHSFRLYPLRGLV
jgi:hypothetical protein